MHCGILASVLVVILGSSARPIVLEKAVPELVKTEFSQPGALKETVAVVPGAGGGEVDEVVSLKDMKLVMTELALEETDGVLGDPSGAEVDDDVPSKDMKLVMTELALEETDTVLGDPEVVDMKLMTTELALKETDVVLGDPRSGGGVVDGVRKDGFESFGVGSAVSSAEVKEMGAGIEPLGIEETVEAETSAGGRARPGPLVSVGVYGDEATVYVGVDHLDSSEVIFMESLSERELMTSPGPFDIIRVVDMLTTTVQEQLLDSYYGSTACSGVCGKEGGMMDVTTCLGCIALSKTHLRPFPVSAER